MRQDIATWCKRCLVCTNHFLGYATHAPLILIPIGGPFERVGVDVIQFPLSKDGNRYSVVFVDFLIKWPEVFTIPDQSSVTIARLLVENIVSRHGVPTEVLSDRDCAILSSLMKEVETLLGFRKINTSAYHPQTDGLVERFQPYLDCYADKDYRRKRATYSLRLTLGFSSLRGVRHGLESRTSHLESLGISHKIWNLALESGILKSVNFRIIPDILIACNSWYAARDAAISLLVCYNLP